MIQSSGSLHLRFRSILAGVQTLSPSAPPPPVRPGSSLARATTSLRFRSKTHCEHHLLPYSAPPLYLLPQLLAPLTEVSTTLTPDPESRQRHATYAANSAARGPTHRTSTLSLSTSDTGARFVGATQALKGVKGCVHLAKMEMTGYGDIPYTASTA